MLAVSKSEYAMLSKLADQWSESIYSSLIYQNPVLVHVFGMEKMQVRFPTSPVKKNLRKVGVGKSSLCFLSLLKILNICFQSKQTIVIL